MAATRSSQTLLLFCKFLAQRVRTENLDVLYNIAVDFLDDPPCFTRVDEMIYRVFPLVAIVPIEITDSSTRAKADKVLKRMRDNDADRQDENELHDLGVALRDRVVLRNWDVLEHIFADFKVGRDQALRAFVALQPQAIAIVPVLPPQHIAPEVAGIRQSEECEMKPDSGERDTEEHEAKPFTSFRKDTPAAIFELVHTIRCELDAIEATAPWNRVFDISTITYPFDAKKHPSLATRLKVFWSRHARAVWHRHFWCRQPVTRRDGDYTVRQIEGKSAAKYYEDSVVVPLFQAFGAAFFVNLDAQPTRLHWWWYREPIVDLVQMASVEGIEYCKRYMMTQQLKVHPTPHPQFHMKSTHRLSPSASMWLVSNNTRHILEAIVDLKKRQKRRCGNATAGKKRSQAPRRANDEEVSSD